MIYHGLNVELFDFEWFYHLLLMVAKFFYRQILYLNLIWNLCSIELNSLLIFANVFVDSELLISNLAFVLNDACCSISEEHDIRDKKKQIVSIFFHGIKDLC